MEASCDQLTCARRLFQVPKVFIGYKFIIFLDRAKSHLCSFFVRYSPLEVLYKDLVSLTVAI